MLQFTTESKGRDPGFVRSSALSSSALNASAPLTAYSAAMRRGFNGRLVFFVPFVPAEDKFGFMNIIENNL